MTGTGGRVNDHRLVGRAQELAIITRTIEACASENEGAALLLRGTAGIGKSRLLLEAGRVARRAGCHVVRARCAADRSALQPIQEALFGLTRDGEALRDPRLMPFLSSLASLTGGSGGDAPRSAESLPVLAEAVLRVLAVRESRGVVLVEDVHWADLETAAVLEYLADHAAEEGIVLVATTRPAETAGAEMAQRVGARLAGRVVDLGPLSRDETHDLVSACLDDDVVAADLTDAVYERTEGVPFLVEEVLSSALAEGVLHRGTEGWECGDAMADIVPRPVANVVLSRADAAGPDVRRVLEAAAVLGRMFAVDDVAEMVERDTGSVAHVLGVASREMFVEPAPRGCMLFRHAITRDAFLTGMTPRERRALSARALLTLSRTDTSTDPVVLARLAEDADDAPLAADFLLRAGREQMARGALRSAEAALRRGVALGEGRALADLRHALLDVLCAAGKTDDARNVGEETLVLFAGIGEDDSRVADVHVELARNAVTAGSLDEAARHADEARRRQPDVLRAARADLVLADVAFARADTATAARLADAVARVARAADDVDLLCSALDVWGRAVRFGDLDAGRAIFTSLLAAATVERRPLWRARALLHLGSLDMLTDGRVDRLAEASAVAEDAGAMGTAAEIEVQTVLILATQFRMAEALVVAERATARAERYKLAIWPLTLVCQGGSHGWLGNRREMERFAAKALDAAGDDPAVAALCWGDLRGMSSLFEDDRARALREIETAMEFPARPITAPAPFRGMWALLRTVEGRDDDIARELVRETAAHESWWVLAWLRYADAVALGRAGRRADAEACAAVADQLIDGHVAGDWAKHLARRHVAEAALAAGWGDPVDWLKDAGAFFDTRHPRISSSCRALLRRHRVVVPRRGRGAAEVPCNLRAVGVTSREMDVLLLLIEGMTNRDIASRLFLSPRTVEKHVESLFQKTAAESRTQLAVVGSKLLA